MNDSSYRYLIVILSLSLGMVGLTTSRLSAKTSDPKYNVLFIISDDLTATALSCYGNKVSQTPHIDRLASQGTLFTSAYCQSTYCGPSRASMLTGYYPSATRVYSYSSGRRAIGDERAMWPEHFKKSGYHTARVSKIYHMGVPGGIERGDHGSDDAPSWTERFNSQGPEWRAPGDGETLEGNDKGQRKGPVGGNTFVVVKADGDDLVHSDGKTAQKAVALLKQYGDDGRQFFLAVGFVRPHVPFVAPRVYHQPYPYQEIVLPEKVEGDWDDIPPPGINYKTSVNMKMNLVQQKKSVSAYYASVAYMDAQVGKVLAGLKEAGLAERTIVIFTSDHGYHLGEHDFWSKVSLHEESIRVPMIIRMPGKKPAVCHSFAELIDLYPTLASMCGLAIPSNIQGKNIAPMMDDPTHQVREAIISSVRSGVTLRDRDWAYIRYHKKGVISFELYDMKKDPLQYTNLANDPAYAKVMAMMQKRLDERLATIKTNDLSKSSTKK